MKKSLKLFNLLIITVALVFSCLTISYAEESCGNLNSQYCRIIDGKKYVVSPSGFTTGITGVGDIVTVERTGKTVSPSISSFGFNGKNGINQIMEPALYYISSTKAGFNKLLNIDLYCLDANLLAPKSLGAERFLLNSQDNLQIRTFDIAAMSILTDSATEGPDSSYNKQAAPATVSTYGTYMAKLIALRGLNYIFNFNHYGSNDYESTINYAGYYQFRNTVSKWLNGDKIVLKANVPAGSQGNVPDTSATDGKAAGAFNALKQAISSANGAFSLNDLSNATSDCKGGTVGCNINLGWFYFSGTDFININRQAEAYFEQALNDAAEYLQNSGDKTEITKNEPEIVDAQGLAGNEVGKDVTIRFRVKNLPYNNGSTDVANNHNEFVITGISGDIPAGISAQFIDIKVDGVSIGGANLLGQNLLNASRSFINSEISVTIRFKGNKSTLDCSNSTFNFNLDGYYTDNQFGKFGKYVGIVWWDTTDTSGRANHQRFTSVVDEDMNNMKKTFGDLFKTEVSLLECSCDLLKEQCDAGNNDACTQVDLVCSGCESVSNGQDTCCVNNKFDNASPNADDYVSVPYKIKGVDEDTEKLCFIEKLDKQFDMSKTYASATNVTDQKGNTYTVEKLKYCAISCTENYKLRLPSAKPTNASRYISFSARVEGEKLCYSTTIQRDQYKEDIEKNQTDLVYAYNEWQKYNDAYKRRDEVSCGFEVVDECAEYLPGTNICKKNERGEDITKVVGYNFSCSIPYTHSTMYKNECSEDKKYGDCIIKDDVGGPGRIPYDFGYVSKSDANSNPQAYAKGLEDDAVGKLANDLSDKATILDSANKEVKATFESYEMCTNNTFWSSFEDIKYGPEVTYEYDEDYMNLLDPNIGHMEDKVNSSGTSEIHYDFDQYENREMNDAYDEPGGAKGTKLKNYISCTKDGCNTSTYRFNVPTVKYKRSVSQIDVTYRPISVFYNNYAANGDIATSYDSNFDLENSKLEEHKLPIKLDTKAGLYGYNIQVKNLGEYYDTKQLGRYFGNNGLFNNVGDRLLYQCAYFVNTSKATIDNLICELEPNCTDDCFNGCIGPNCDGECDGLDCNHYCLGINCVYDDDSGEAFFAKPTSLKNMFPNGVSAYNWKNEKGVLTRNIIENASATSSNGEVFDGQDGDNLYTETPILSVTLTPETRNIINRYNEFYSDNGGYSNRTLSCKNISADGTNYEKIACYSSFISDLLDDKVVINGDVHNVSAVNKDNSSMVSVRRVTDNNTEYFKLWPGTIRDDLMIGPSWK